MVCYPHVAKGSTDRLVAECKERKKEGWRFVRWGLSDPKGENLLEPSRAVRFGIEQVKAVREEVGDEIEICFDVHTRLDPASAIALANGIESYLSLIHI